MVSVKSNKIALYYCNIPHRKLHTTSRRPRTIHNTCMYEGHTWTELSTVTRGLVGMWEPFLWPTNPGDMAATRLPNHSILDPSIVSDSGGNSTALWCAYSQEISNGGFQSIVWAEVGVQCIVWAEVGGAMHRVGREVRTVSESQPTLSSAILTEWSVGHWM